MFIYYSPHTDLSTGAEEGEEAEHEQELAWWKAKVVQHEQCKQNHDAGIQDQPEPHQDSSVCF